MSVVAPAASASAARPPASAALPSLSLSQWSPPDRPSKPPTPAEWEKGPEIEVHNARKLNCEVKLVREWVRVSCRSNNQQVGAHVTELRWIEPKTKPAEFYDLVNDRVASLVLPIRRETKVRVEFVWFDVKHSLFISWSPGTPKPVIFFQGDVPRDLSKPGCSGACPGFLSSFPRDGAKPCSEGPWTVQDPTDSGVCLCRPYAKGECVSDL